MPYPARRGYDVHMDKPNATTTHDEHTHENAPSGPAERNEACGEVFAPGARCHRSAGHSGAHGAPRSTVDEVEAALARAPEDVAARYREARKELAALGTCLAAMANARSEAEALDYARAVRSTVARVGVQWCRARAELAASLSPRIVV